MMGSGIARAINIICLVAGIIIILLLPRKKEIWYDETISMMCSKGITHDTPQQFAGKTKVNSSEIEKLNTNANVFTATVLDNGNSYLYNIGLHWFTSLFGNSLQAYMLFSKLAGVALLIGFYMLCNLFLRKSIFAGIAIMLLATDNNIIAMTHEIRAYAIGTFFVTAAAVFYYRFMYKDDSPVNLFLTGLFSVCAVMSHFLSAYIVLVLLAGLLLGKRSGLFTATNILAMIVPLAITAIYLYFTIDGLRIMSVQNRQIQSVHRDFSAQEVMYKAMQFTSVNFKILFSAFVAKKVVIVISFLFSLSLYAFGWSAAVTKKEKTDLNLLFALSISSTIFLTILCLRSHHYTALYYRYFSFGAPFCSLYIAYVLALLYNNPRMNKMVIGSLGTIVLLPVCGYFAYLVYKAEPRQKYNHIAVAEQIREKRINRVAVPEWKDALLIQCVLPAGYNIDYEVTPASTNFILFSGNNSEQIPVVRNNS